MVSKFYQSGFPLSALLILFGLGLAAASPSPVVFDLIQRNATTETPQPLDCTTEFSSDYYGFGVRLGVYFAWLSSYFANTLLPSEIAGSLDTNSIFLLGLLISLFKSSMKGEIMQIDGLIIMQLSSGFLFSSLSMWGYRTSYYQRDGPTAIQQFGKFGTHCRLALALAISVYGTYFWWEGLEDGLAVPENPQCQKLYTWFFAYLPIRGGIHILYIFMSLSCSIYYGTMFLVAVVAHFVKLIHVGWKEKMSYETGYSRRELKFMFNLFRIFNLFWILFCAMMIEMTLTKNNMLQTFPKYGKIAYPAQLIPLIVGVLSFLRVLWLVYAEWKEADEKKSRRRNEDADARTEKAKLPSLYHFSIDIFKRIFSSSAQPEPSPPPFEVEQPDMPEVLRPYHHRYAIALLPWLSTFKSWRIGQVDRDASSPDIERPYSLGSKKDFKGVTGEVATD